jgi:hypothetical protein
MVTWFATLALCGLTAEKPAEMAVDLTKVERTIRKEPEYKSKAPRYCLLVFGPRADYRVWLVLDGDTLYVDRNGNGDLTEPGKSTRPERRDRDPCSFAPVVILGPDGKTEEQLKFALYGWFDYSAGKDTSRVFPSLNVSWRDRWFGSWGDETGPCVWGLSPQDAPVLHIGGPLQMGFESRADYALKRTGDSQFELNVGVGTKGLGKGAFVHLCYADGAIPEGLFPTAVLEFPGKTSGGLPVRVRAVLKQRC